MAFTSGLDPILLAMEIIDNNNCNTNCADLYSLTATAETENNCIEFIASDTITVAATTEVEVELETEASESDIKSNGCSSTNESNENHVNADPHLFLTNVASADESNCCSTDDKADLELADGDVNNINDANVLTVDESDLTEENNYKYTTAGVNAMLKENFSSDEGDPFKNGYVVYLLSIEKKSSNVIKHLMDVASRKNFQFNPSSFSSKMRAVHKSFIKYKSNIKRCWPKMMAFLEEPCQIPAPKAKKNVEKSIIEVETIAIQKPQISERVLKSDCVKCAELRASLRDCTSLLKKRLKDSRMKLKETKNGEMRRLKQSLKRKNKIIFKLRTERSDLKENNTLLSKKRDKLKADLRSNKLPGRQPQCHRRHAEDYEKIIRKKNKRIKELELIIDDLQCQIETTMLEK